VTAYIHRGGAPFSTSSPDVVERRGPLVYTPASYPEGPGTDLGPKLMHMVGGGEALSI